MRVKEEELEQFHDKVAKLAADCRGTVLDVDAEAPMDLGEKASSSSSRQPNESKVLREQDLDDKLTRWFLKKTTALSDEVAGKVRAHRKLVSGMSVQTKIAWAARSMFSGDLTRPPNYRSL